MSRPPFPPFTDETAAQKARMAEDAWNGRDPAKVALAYTPDSRWRNRSEFLEGRAAIVKFLTRKWEKELDYRLIKDIWAFDRNFIAVRFQYEWHDAGGQWHRSYGNEQWEFDEQGLMRRREASINDIEIAEKDPAAHTALMRVKSKEVGGDGHANADVTFKLNDGGGDIHTSAQIVGKAASMGEGVVVGVLDALIGDFAGKVGEA